ncbi:response regulator [Methylosinus sp. H3A]|uniref:hybrid sensor histidine kinase/response regulator n=1 Tax=Methylosinus sp. H3A TaxID=2785786 RepID=UPI0018C34BE0|nr:response regulator [Methylosinus sp. H3A]MBG0810540.1 response regulator [Methylosinus sp. H3A]
MMRAIENSSNPSGRRRSSTANFDAGRTSKLPVVLIVDDFAENLIAMEAMLRCDEFEIVTAQSGRAALDILLDRSVALAIIDVHMPEMDGFELATLMRGVEKTRYVPIVFVTAHSPDVARMFKGYEVGAVDYLFKPIDQQVLRGKVDVFVTLERQRQQLLQIEHMREMFVGILGHDLRNPLQSILTSAERSLTHAQDDNLRKALQVIRQSGGRMARMIEQILDLTRIRVGSGLAIRPAAADFRRIVEQIADEFAGRDGALRLDFYGDMQGAWDVDRILQLLSNLVGNAVEHSPPGSEIVLHVDGASADWLRIDVCNEGRGVPGPLRDALFEPFTSGDRMRGLGLGLFICRQIVLAHGGTIEYESDDDHGTRFRILLPRRCAIETRPTFELRDAFGDGARMGFGPRTSRVGVILVVDDDPDVRDSLELLLTTEGHEVLSAADGDAATELVVARRARPDMVIIDYHLPNGAHGPIVVRRLRELLNRDLPALVLSGGPTDAEAGRIPLQNSAQLGKPADVERLLETIQRLLLASAGQS